MKAQLILSLLGLPLAAYGYTDPGTGVFVYQAIAATIMGAGWTARRFIGRLFGKGQMAKGAGVAATPRPTVAGD